MHLRRQYTRYPYANHGGQVPVETGEVALIS
jgi:hypothetical protein